MSNHDYVIRQGSIQINSLAGQQNVFLTVDSNGLVVASGFTSGSFITASTLAPITAALQSQITEQGNINSIQSVQIAGITATYTPLSTTAAISANLQNQINNLPIGTVIADITATQALQSTQIQSITGRLTDVEVVNTLQSSAIASLSGSNTGLQTQVNSITGRVFDLEVVNGLQSVAIASLSAADVVINSRLSDVEIVNTIQSGQIASISAAIAVIAIPSLSGYALTSDVAAISGYLQSEIVSVSGRVVDAENVNTLQSSAIASISGSLDSYATLAAVANLTGQVLSQVANTSANLQSQISGVTQSLTGYYTKTESDGLFVHLAGDEVIYGNKTFNDNVVILGSLTVAGSATFLNSTEVLIKDNFITLNSNVTAGAPVLDAGIQVSRGNQPSAELRWNETLDVWQIGISGSTSEILTVANAGSSLDSRFVNITGDTMSGTLYITGADLSIVGGQLNLDTANIKYSENTQVDTGTEVVDSFANTTGNGAMWIVSVRNGVNVRTSQVIACWVGSTVEYTEVSTLDLGSTSGLTLFVDNNVGANGLIRLQATAISNGWVVKAIRNVL
jgi:hypothetical protein